WGWAPDYVEAMYRMLQQDQPEDFVIATGHTASLEDFVAAVFAHVGLDWRSHVQADASLLRPSDIAISRNSPQKAKEKLGWTAQYLMPDVARKMVDALLNPTLLPAISATGNGSTPTEVQPSSLGAGRSA
ncbi:MAG: hypothetical protein D6742_02385, partial [Cyanobacteria bacterium J069]